MEAKTLKPSQLDTVAIKVINLLSYENVCIRDIDYIFEAIKNIINMETKIKKIEI